MDNIDELSDEALIKAIAGGATWAMEPLYLRYSRILYSLAYRMVADQQVAEDLLQDAFLSVWRRAISYSPQSGAVRSWLVSIIHHRTIDYLRGVRRRSAMKETTWEEGPDQGTANCRKGSFDFDDCCAYFWTPNHCRIFEREAEG